MKIGIHLRTNVEITTWDVSTSDLEHLAYEGRGIILARQRTHNLFVLSGRNIVRDFLAGDNVKGLQYFGLGTSADAVLDAQTDLVLPLSRIALTQRVRSSSAVTAKFFLGSANLNGSTLREAGLFSELIGGPMFARALITPEIVKNETIAQTFAWTITLTGL